MIDWTKYNKLNNELNNKRVELIQAPTEEEKNAIKAEMKNLEKQIEKVLGKKEYSRLKEVRNRDSRDEKQIIKNYYAFKETESKINPFSIAIKKFLRIVMRRNEKSKSAFVVIKNDEKVKEMTRAA